MSSEIYYEKAFISIGDRFIPLVCRGSTNTFEFNVHGREVAERYWSVLDLPYRDRLLFTSDEIQKIAETYEGFSSGNRGGMRKSRNSAFEAGEFQRWFLAGLKNAHTMEENAPFFSRVPFSVECVRSKEAVKAALGLATS